MADGDASGADAASSASPSGWASAASASARFVSESLVASDVAYPTSALERGEPPLPASFAWRGRTLRVARLVRTWRSTKLDRGDAYLARHWYELALDDGATAIVYFDRKARRAAPRWWLYSLAEPAEP